MSRDYTEYAERKYLDVMGPAHIVCFGETTALCGLQAGHDEWYGTGDWDETEHAAWLSLCKDCGLDAYPYLAPVIDPDRSDDPAVEMWREAITTTPHPPEGM